MSIRGAGNPACSRLSSGFFGFARIIKLRRLKAGGSQDWLPHIGFGNLLNKST
jgi:hypothetical protein